MASLKSMTWKQVKHVSERDTPTTRQDMRYFVYYPPSRSIRLIDVSDNVLVEDILTLVKKEFSLNTEDSGPSETSIVLNFNGTDLKPNWSLIDFSIPPGSIIRCLYREKKAADLYVLCSYNKQILKLFDPTITTDTTVSTIRKKISNELGLPLSTFCLETYATKQRLYDDMRLMDYDVKIHDHLYLKVWRGYEKFINACIKGFTEQYAHDDLTRHYQAQTALYIAAFYGHMELASYAMQQGARCDQPVGEHPSRQWSFESAAKELPEILKCPIHIAVERGHQKIIDLFIRLSITCTQVRDPITGYLPYRLALFCAHSAKRKDDQQNYNAIYFTLHDKQYNFRVPLNASGEYVSDLLTSTVSTNVFHRSSTNYFSISLPLYCRIIKWYERAREKVWKKYSGRLYHAAHTKRIYPKQGLLGYRVLIDGYNNHFEVPTEQRRNIKSGGTSKSTQDGLLLGFDEEEQEKINQMKSFVKDFAMDERTRAKRIAAEHLQQSRRPPVVVPPPKSSQNKSPSKTVLSSYNITNRQEKTINKTNKTSKLLLENENLLKVPNATPASFNKRIDNSQDLIDETKFFKPMTPTTQSTRSRTTSSNEGELSPIPILKTPAANAIRHHTTLTGKLQKSKNENQKNFKPVMSSADAYVLASTRVELERQQNKEAKQKELYADIKRSVEEQPQPDTKPLNASSLTSFNSERKIIDIDTYLPLPDQKKGQRSASFKSRRDVEIYRSTIDSYQRHASASTRSTAIDCLQQASGFKGKSWLKQVEISKEMIKHTVRRRMRRVNLETNDKPVLLPLRATTGASSVTTHTPGTIKVN